MTGHQGSVRVTTPRRQRAGHQRSSTARFSEARDRRRRLASLALVGVATVGLCSSCGSKADSVSAGTAGSSPGSTDGVQVSVSIPDSASEARGAIVAGLIERGESESFGQCAVDVLDTQLQGGERRFAIVMLSSQHASEAEMTADIAATGLGVVPSDLPQRVFLMLDACRGIEDSVVSTTATSASPQGSQP